MQPLYTFKQFALYALDEDFMMRYGDQICQSLDQIPLVEKHSVDQLLAIQKNNKDLYHKFEHSLIALSETAYAGVIIGYERKSENNDQYPKNSIYMSELAVDAGFQKQGLGRFLVKSWLDFNKKTGFLKLDGEAHFSVQTNSAAWNTTVQKLYSSFGFKKIAEKIYDNRTDNVYFM